MRISPKRALAAPILDVMNFLNEVAQRYPAAISFAPGRPSEHLFDVEQALRGVDRYLEHVERTSSPGSVDLLASLGQYGRTNGIIHDAIADYLARDEGMRVAPDSVVVTTGAQEAMSILLQALFEPQRDTLLVSDPSYIGITGAAAILGVGVHPVQSGPDGLEPEAVLAAVREVRARGRTPKALYDVPDFNNPMGTCMPLEARHRLLDLAERENLLVIEDNPYGAFAYDDARVPTLKSLDRRGNVVYIGTFSKLLFPGLRIGYLVADQEVAQGPGNGRRLLAHELSKVKSLVTVNTSPLLQAFVAGVLLEHGGSLVETNEAKVAFYRANRDRLLSALEAAFGRDPALAPLVRWNRPRGGFFAVVDLPFEFDEACVERCAAGYGVIVCPMSFFSLGGGRDRQVRLAFSYVTPDGIEEGISRFARFVRDAIGGGLALSETPRAARASSKPDAVNLADLERAARAALPNDAWDYIAGGSDDETTLRANVEAFQRIQIRPRVLVDVDRCDLTTSVLGTKVDLPVLLAPLAYQRLAHEEGEIATARAAARSGTIMVVSTMSNEPLESVAAAEPSARHWFQLYAQRDKQTTASLVRRAEDAGYGAIVLTVDAPRLGRRERDLANGFALPPHLTAANLPPSNRAQLNVTRGGASAIAEHARSKFDATLTWEVLAWLRSLTKLPIVLKGVLTEEDGRLAVEHGAAGVVVSNHGGRQLDGSPATIDVLEEVAAATAGRCEVYLDGGVRRGTDILKALALGARAVLIGRPVMWGLAVGGEAGVMQALDILRRELDLAMALAGRPVLERIDPTAVAHRWPR